MQTVLRLVTVLVLAGLISACRPVRRFPDSPPTPPGMQVPVTEGWMLIGAQAEMFEFFMDSTVAHRGQFSGSLKAIPANDGNAGASAWQLIRSDDYRGKRLRYTGWLKTENVTSMAALSMTIDDDTGWPAAFDNMYERRAFVVGDSDWKLYEIVLDVPENAREIGFGINLGGKGQVWFDDLQFEVVGDDVPVTMGGISEKMLNEQKAYWAEQGEEAWKAKEERAKARLAQAETQPVNLGFEGQ